MIQLSLFEQMQQLQVPKKDTNVNVRTLTKVYYTITEVADMFHVNASLLRFWEKEFPTQLSQIKKNKKGDRYYNKKNIETLNLLFYLIKEKKMTLEGAREHLKNNKKKVKGDIDLIKNLETVKAFLYEIKNSLG